MKKGLTGKLWEVQINHSYMIGANGKPRVHACLVSGMWCWENARERPKDIIKFLRKKYA